MLDGGLLTRWNDVAWWTSNEVGMMLDGGLLTRWDMMLLGSEDMGLSLSLRPSELLTSWISVRCQQYVVLTH